MTSHQYENWFFQLQTDESRAAAAVVVPLLMKLAEPSPMSVLDVGGGVGAWANAFMENGVDDTVCVDGDYVDRARLLVPPHCYLAHDLTAPLDLGRRFDLAICLEVAEHLPATAARTIVRSLTCHADLVAFSAAIPHQGGERHVNEQWPSYWREIFLAEGYEAFDIVRPLIWRDERVGFWFRQNLMVFARHEASGRLAADRKAETVFDVVHPESWTRRNQTPPPTIRQAARALVASLGRRLRR